MSFFGVGPLELLVVLVIALLVVGPNDLVAFARKMGKWLRKLRHTEAWQGVVRASWELQHWQERLWEETGLRDIRLRRPEESIWHPQVPWITPPLENPPSNAPESPTAAPPSGDRPTEAPQPGSESSSSPPANSRL